MQTRAALIDQNRTFNEPCYATVFYGRPRIQRIAVCDFKRVSLHILSLPSPTLHPAVEVRIELLKPVLGASLPNHVFEHLKGRMLVPGNVDQLIALASKFSQYHYHGLIVALGSMMICKHGARLFPALHMEDDGELVLALVPAPPKGQPWDPRCRFIGYREGNGFGLWPPSLR